MWRIGRGVVIKQNFVPTSENYFKKRYPTDFYALLYCIDNTLVFKQIYTSQLKKNNKFRLLKPKEKIILQLHGPSFAFVLILFTCLKHFEGLLFCVFLLNHKKIKKIKRKNPSLNVVCLTRTVQHYKCGLELEL